MNDEILSRISQTTNVSAQAQVLQYFEFLKNSENGWEMCASALLSRQYSRDDQIRYFCMQVIEHFVHKIYPSYQSVMLKQNMRNFVVNILQLVVESPEVDKSFMKNKLAQVVSLVFLVDYPSTWPSFFSDLIQYSCINLQAADIYLRILKAIDTEVVDREVTHTISEQTRNTNIKDYMREQCVPALVDSLYNMMTKYENVNPELVCLCLEVIGLYISWIDINLIANDRVVPVLIRFLKKPLLRESACDCVTEIVHKGMDADAKVKLIESFTSVLENAGVMFPDEDEEGDFVMKLSKMVNAMGENLVMAWTKSVKVANNREALAALNAIEGKVSMMCRFLSDEDDDVSSAICPFVNSYVGILKQLKPLTDKQRQNVQDITRIIFKKFEYSPDYDFNDEGEEEAMFQEYRKSLKLLFSSIAKMDQSFMLNTVHQVLSGTLQNWQQVDFREVEVSLLLVYMLGEALPASQNQHFKGDAEKANALQQMLKMIITSGVSRYLHQAVTLQYFETLVRYEKFFQVDPSCIAEVLISFLDERGLRNPCSGVRSRVSYLFTKFIKAVRNSLQIYTDTILTQLQGLLVLNVPYADQNGGSHPWLTNEEQMFLFEVASQLIVSSDLPVERKKQLMMSLLTPVIQEFKDVYAKLCQEPDPVKQQAYAECLNCAMSFASRASKGFSNQVTVKACGCVEVFTDCLSMFIQALNSPYQRAILQQGVRQFFHRMVVCLEADILPFVPTMVNLILETPDVKELYDFVPVLTQLVTKFKRTLEPFLEKAFMPLVGTIFTVVNSPTDSRDLNALNDKKLLRRGYFTFISNLMTSELSDVIKNQDFQNLHQVLMTIVQGCSDIPDCTAQKICFGILKDMIETWADEGSTSIFNEFMFKSIVPACIVSPTKDTFDWRDGATVLLLGDISACLHAAYTKGKAQLIKFLLEEYFPSLQLNSSISQQFCTQLSSDDKKQFKDYLKVFYGSIVQR